VISLESRLTLAGKARLRLDRKSGHYMLLYPEKGMRLNATAADIVQLCTGEHTVAEIIERLAAKYAAQPRTAIEKEVLTFLEALSERMLVCTET